MTRQRKTQNGEKTDRKRERERERKKRKKERKEKKEKKYKYITERKKEARERERRERERERERERVRARASDLDSELKGSRRRMAEPRFHVCDRSSFLVAFWTLRCDELCTYALGALLYNRNLSKAKPWLRDGNCRSLLWKELNNGA